MKKCLLIILLLILTACSQSGDGSVFINNKKIKVEIADTAEAQYQGLSGRQSICQDCGMVFIFPDKQIRTFVMRDMKFGLDIIWIDSNRIVKIDKGLPPEGADPINKYFSGEPVNYVLEVNSDFAGQNNIKVGDKVSF